MVTDWEPVEADDFYLTEDWAENVEPKTLQDAKELQANGQLFVAYTVPAVHYAIFVQMDAGQVFINSDGDEIMSCESAIINNHHQKRFEYGY